MKQLLISVLFAISLNVNAEDYPTKPVKFVVPYPPGGVVDICARFMAQALTTNKRTVIVENRPGGTGIVAANYVAGQQADGYTIFVGNITPNAIDPDWFNKPPRDNDWHFQAVAMLATHPHVLVTAFDYTAQQLMDRFKHGAPYASDGVGGPAHLLMLQMAPKGLQIPYRGGAQSTQAIVAKEVIGGFVPGPAGLPWIQNGKLKAVAQAADKRTAPYENIPTLKELGYNGNVLVWTGLFVAQGTPQEIVQYWNKEVNAVLNGDAQKYRMIQIGLSPASMTAKEFGTFVQQEHDRYRKLVKEKYKPQP